MIDGNLSAGAGVRFNV